MRGKLTPGGLMPLRITSFNEARALCAGSYLLGGFLGGER